MLHENFEGEESEAEYNRGLKLVHLSEHFLQHLPHRCTKQDKEHLFTREQYKSILAI